MNVRKQVYNLLEVEVGKAEGQLRNKLFKTLKPINSCAGTLKVRFTGFFIVKNVLVWVLRQNVGGIPLLNRSNIN